MSASPALLPAAVLIADGAFLRNISQKVVRPRSRRSRSSALLQVAASAALPEAVAFDHRRRPRWPFDPSADIAEGTSPRRCSSLAGCAAGRRMEADSVSAL